MTWGMKKIEDKDHQKKLKKEYLARHPDRRKESTKKFREKTKVSHWPSRTLQAIKQRCKNSNLECSITKEDITPPQYCPVLGIELLIGEDSPRDNSPSVDRIDNSRGYIKNNVKVISMRANRFKSDATIEELRLLADYYLSITKF